MIVSANKPGFFAKTDPIYRVVDEAESLLRPHYGKLEAGDVYFGGNARLVEDSLGAIGRLLAAMKLWRGPVRREEA